MKIFSAVVFYFFAFQICFAQSDSLYTKYDAIVVGIQNSYSGNYMLLNYNLQTGEALHARLKPYSNISSGLTIRTKYMSFFVNIKPLTNYLDNLFNPGGWFYKENPPVYRAFSFNYSFKKFLFRSHLNMNSGVFAFVGNNIATELEFLKLTVGGEYFFNTQFSFSRANSALYFPKKSYSTFSFSGNFIYNKTNGVVTPEYVLHYNSKFYGLELLPGVHCYLTKNQFNSGRKNRKAFVFLNPSLNAGATLFFGETKANPHAYDTKQFSISYNARSTIKFGLNTKNMYLEVSSGAQLIKFSQDNYSETHLKYYGSFLLGFRIPYKKGYEKTDAFFRKLNPFKKREKEL